MAQGQGHKKNPRLRPRTGMLQAKAKDTNASVFLRKKVLKIFFGQSPKKNGLEKHFQPIYKILTIQKIVLSSSRGQSNFRGLAASRPRPRTWPSRPSAWKCVLEANDVLENSTSGTISDRKTQSVNQPQFYSVFCKTTHSLYVDWKLTVFFLFTVHFYKICRFVQSEWLFSSRFTRAL